MNAYRLLLVGALILVLLPLGALGSCEGGCGCQNPADCYDCSCVGCDCSPCDCVDCGCVGCNCSSCDCGDCRCGRCGCAADEAAT